jgi:hypothetical protein
MAASSPHFSTGDPVGQGPQLFAAATEHDRTARPASLHRAAGSHGSQPRSGGRRGRHRPDAGVVIEVRPDRLVVSPRRWDGESPHATHNRSWSTKWSTNWCHAMPVVSRSTPAMPRPRLQNLQVTNTAGDYGSRGYRFESCRARPIPPAQRLAFCPLWSFERSWSTRPAAVRLCMSGTRWRGVLTPVIHKRSSVGYGSCSLVAAGVLVGGSPGLGSAGRQSGR